MARRQWLATEVRRLSFRYTLSAGYSTVQKAGIRRADHRREATSEISNGVLEPANRRHVPSGGAWPTRPVDTLDVKPYAASHRALTWRRLSPFVFRKSK